MWRSRFATTTTFANTGSCQRGPVAVVEGPPGPERAQGVVAGNENRRDRSRGDQDRRAHLAGLEHAGGDRASGKSRIGPVDRA